ncbi:uncharacterized protein N7459_002229 [Penicillium hispanicum]|uniref:uncharacterized protein n=1 Tax=Penicillium hispanicum TaxID=1080232 RepID=UPI0025413999|nr:uncharacterized protein N7459_002229 [Penicillium hispanicum]KAJ5591860.1 hypothetical protein N7459_002229 [Penicillium hispanicum]
MATVECMPMASRHHPHHPYNQHSGRDRRPSVNTNIGSNNPYARYMSPSPSLYSRQSVSESVPSVWWSGEPEHHPAEPRRKCDTSVPQRRRSSHRTYPQHSELVNPDIIDRLDDVTAYSYHHEGPYDAVYPERNRVSHHSPLEAVRESNEEALRATPRDKIVDCLNSHRPLDGTAFFPPGTTDRNGQTYDYEEGFNMMSDSGNFMRLPGLKFTDEDFKNDPFYNRPISNPFTQLRKKLSLHRAKKRRSTA